MAEGQGGSRRPTHPAPLLLVPGRRGRGLLWAWLFLWRGCGLSKLGRGGGNRGAHVELGACEPRPPGGVAIRGRTRMGGASRGRGPAASQAPLVWGAGRALFQPGLVVGGSGPRPLLGPERGLWPAPRVARPARRTHGGHQGPARVVPAAVRGLPGCEHHQHDHFVPRRPGLLRDLAPAPA